MEHLSEIIRRKLDDIQGEGSPDEDMIEVSTEPKQVKERLNALRKDYQKEFDEMLRDFESE